LKETGRNLLRLYYRLCRALIKEQARKELEREQQTEAEIEKLKSVYGEKEPEVKEAPEQAGYSDTVKDRTQCWGSGSAGCFWAS
jgi:hypothetical protein